MANENDMKKVLATAMFDRDFRTSLSRDPAAAAKTVGVELNEGQVSLLREVGARLSQLDPSKLSDFRISVGRSVDLSHGDPIGPVSGHGSTQVTW